MCYNIFMQYKIIKQKRKTICVIINDLGEIIVKAPTFLTDEKIENFVNSKRGWIAKKLAHKTYINNTYNLVINKQKALIFNEICEYTANFKDTAINLANDYLPNRLKYLASLYDFKFNKIIIKNYKSRWGACNKSNDIYLNYKLVMLDKDLIDFVILHELCHTIHFNHQSNFHKLLKRLSKKSKKELNEFSFILKINY